MSLRVLPTMFVFPLMSHDLTSSPVIYDGQAADPLVDLSAAAGQQVPAIETLRHV